MWSSLFLMVAALSAPEAAAPVEAPDAFRQAVLEQAYEALVPAVGVVSFTTEVTNNRTGNITKRDSSALGLIVSRDGLLITHGHLLLENSQPTNIRFTAGQGDDEKEYDAVLLKKPDDVNLCFLRLVSDDPIDLPAVSFTEAEPFGVGEPVAVIGLLAQTLDYARAVLTCRIGAVLDKPRTTYCLDQPIRFGYVTGPVIDTRGHLVGVVGFDLSMQEGGDFNVRSGHPLVYQTALFQRYIDTPPGENEIADETEDAWLGVLTQPLTDDFAEYWGIDQAGGVIVSTVVAGSPAERAGLESGDIIVRFNDIRVEPRLDREVRLFTKLVRETGVGARVPIRLLRDGERLDVEVELDARPIPAREADEYEDKTLGLTLRELTTDVRIVLSLPDEVQGVIIRRIRSGSIAHLAGMRPGIIIMNLGDRPVTNLEDFKAAVQAIEEEKPDEIPVFCRAGSVTGFYRLEPRWNQEE